ncbi:hypothetical protein [Marinimicrobium sp. ABcell2]|uniref:hypothetical protein n=1 Tax=Marinimicrobium sp. ABcell2 TaxID=3069751 RepID=UPI0027B5863F|nr:hypothetical protein [Marinimicrobium sp. ABcell2]MDQ2077537.1 hypothetical protein [Marinimicrobium sp. ABcell2]
MEESDLPDLLDQFAVGADVANHNAPLVKLANAKWQGALIGALSECREQGGDLAQLGDTYRDLAKQLLVKLDCDPDDQRLHNTAMQALIRPVTREVREHGTLNGQWLDDYAQTLKQLPAMVRIISYPTTASTSMGMTLANHHAELINLSNTFSFLRAPADVASWAHTQIDPHAYQMAKKIAPHDETGPAYQNQLNVHRKLFIGAYYAEARQWQGMLEDSPSSARLYPDGIPLTGVQTRFQEQAELLKQLIEPEQQQTLQSGISR